MHPTARRLASLPVSGTSETYRFQAVSHRRVETTPQGIYYFGSGPPCIWSCFCPDEFISHQLKTASPRCRFVEDVETGEAGDLFQTLTGAEGLGEEDEVGDLMDPSLIFSNIRLGSFSPPSTTAISKWQSPSLPVLLQSLAANMLLRTTG